MSEETKTETEQIYDDLTKEPKETTEELEEVVEQDEEQPEGGEDEILTEEELDVQREIEAYATKTAALDEKLAKFKADKVDKVKRDTMFDFHYNEDQVERYVRHIQGETAEEIKQSVMELTGEIPAKDSYADPSPLNGASEKPVPNTRSKLEEIGRRAFERVKHKIRF